MKKILKFLKCKDKEELVYKFKESNDLEISELRETLKFLTSEALKKKELGQIKNNDQLLDFLRLKIGFKDNEEFVVIFVNGYNKVIAYETLFKGTIDKSAVYPRNIMEKVFQYKAKGVIFAHNHPSGNLRPSKQDIQITEHMQEALDLISVKLLDHVIIGADGYFSFYEEGIII